MNQVLSLIKEVKLTSDIQEIVRLFITGKWIMIDATEQDGRLKAFMGRYR